MKVKDLTDEQVEVIFNKMMEEKMSDTQFWDWVADWKGQADLIKQAKEWNIQTKRDDLNSWEIDDEYFETLEETIKQVTE